MIEKRFAFDLELFVVARQQGFRNFIEMPVTISERFSSTVSIHSVRNMLLDTFAIFYRLRVLRFYERDIRAKSEASLLNPPSAPTQIPASKRTSPIPVTDGERRLRILVLNWRDITHPHAGGAEVYTHNVANEWVKEGHVVTLFCAAVDGKPEIENLRWTSKSSDAVLVTASTAKQDSSIVVKDWVTSTSFWMKSTLDLLVLPNGLRTSSYRSYPSSLSRDLVLPDAFSGGLRRKVRARAALVTRVPRRAHGDGVRDEQGVSGELRTDPRSRHTRRATTPWENLQICHAKRDQQWSLLEDFRRKTTQ